MARVSSSQLSTSRTLTDPKLLYKDISQSIWKNPHKNSSQRTDSNPTHPISTIASGRISKDGSHRTTKSLSKAAGLIRVTVNNRLGTKREIPCSPSDTIADFKKLVAVYSGSRPETILLKRQGMRPFKDPLTLGDYEVGDGSSLDLEIDTGE